MNTPIFNALGKYASSGTLPFHMPGHKMGRGLPTEFNEALLSIDITEIPGSDYLHHPTGIIKEAQDLAAEAFGADRTYFLVNGSTCGIYAMICTICNPGDSLVVARDCHKSVINAMMLAGVDPIYIMPEYDSDFHITSIICPEKLEKILDNKSAAGVLITRPNYYGACCDIVKIASIVHSHGKILAVDEAHGAHLKFCNRLPVCAMDAGADICVQSAHKTLPALTQGAYLHVKSDKIDIGKLEKYLEIYQTSSPSYLIMASLDMAREIMQSEGWKHLRKLTAMIKHYELSLSDIPVNFLNEKSDDKYNTDVTRITANVGNLGITGYKAEEYLRDVCGIQVEMSDMSNIVGISTIADDEAALGCFFTSIRKLVELQGYNEPLMLIDGSVVNSTICTQQMDFNAVMQRKPMLIRLNDAVGRISGDIISPYPPGVPVVCPGELISREVVDYLLYLLDAGGRVNGISENMQINVI